MASVLITSIAFVNAASTSAADFREGEESDLSSLKSGYGRRRYVDIIWHGAPGLETLAPRHHGMSNSLRN